MKTSKKILLTWTATIAVFGLGYALLPHHDVRVATVAYNSIANLLFFISLFIYLKEPNRKYKIIFLNFTLFFAMSFLFQITYFVGKSFFVDLTFASHYFQVFSVATYIFFFSLAIVYVVIDLLFQDFKTYQKYLSALAAVLFFFVYYFQPFFSDARHLYSTEDIKQYKVLYEADALYTEKFGKHPAPEELASLMSLPKWENGIAVGDLYYDQKVKRIKQLLPYLDGDNYKILLWKPFYYNLIFMDVMMMGFILLFFGYQYKKDPPQGAYVVKMMYLFFLLVSLDAVHNWSFIKSLEWKSISEIFAIGQYISLAILVSIAVIFAMRLRFISSVQGEFYESELATNPQLISRWRDGLDNLVIRHFFNPKPVTGRLFEESH